MAFDPENLFRSEHQSTKLDLTLFVSLKPLTCRPAMYSLPSYLPGDIKVEPTSGMYQLESFHDILPSTRISTKDFDPVKDLEMKQLTLIQRLVSFNKALEEHLKGEKKLPQKSDGQPVEESVKETKKKGKPEASALKSRANKNVDKIENITARAPFKIQVNTCKVPHSASSLKSVIK